MKYDVSILVPIYNGERFIERCLHSLFGQTYENIQFVFVNDCTPDNSIKLLQTILLQYPHRQNHVKVVEHTQNRGLAGARNTGIEHAEGEYVLHIDSDDFVELDMVAEKMSIARKEDADVVVSDFYLQWEKHNNYVVQNFAEAKTEFVEMLLNAEAQTAVWNKMFRRCLYTQNKISAIQGVNFGEDVIVTPKLVYHSQKIVKLNRAFVHYVQYNSGSYSKKKSDKNMEDVLVVLDHLHTYFADKPNSDKFQKAIIVSKIRKKIEFIKQSTPDNLKRVLEKFPEDVTMYNNSNFGFFDRILVLTSKKNFFVFKSLVNAYQFLFSTVQILKGR